MNKFTKVLGLGVLTIGVLAACGQETKDVEVKDNANAEVKEEKKEEKKEAKLGSRSNPVPFQSTGSIDDVLYDNDGNEFKMKFDLTVTEVIRGEEAYNKLMQMNEFNEAAPEGYEWMLVKTKVAFTESETQDISWFIDGTMNFDVITETGDIYAGDIYGTTEPDFSFEMYVGNEKEGYIARPVKVGEEASLRYTEILGGHVFFNLK